MYSVALSKKAHLLSLSLKTLQKIALSRTDSRVYVSRNENIKKTLKIYIERIFVGSTPVWLRPLFKPIHLTRARFCMPLSYFNEEWYGGFILATEVSFLKVEPLFIREKGKSSFLSPPILFLCHPFLTALGENTILTLPRFGYQTKLVRNESKLAESNPHYSHVIWAS